MRHTELSIGWVDPRVGLGCVGLGRDFFSILVGWVGSETFPKILKLGRPIYYVCNFVKLYVL